MRMPTGSRHLPLTDSSAPPIKQSCVIFCHGTMQDKSQEVESVTRVQILNRLLPFYINLIGEFINPTILV